LGLTPLTHQQYPAVQRYPTSGIQRAVSNQRYPTSGIQPAVSNQQGPLPAAGQLLPTHKHTSLREFTEMWVTLHVKRRRTHGRPALGVRSLHDPPRGALLRANRTLPTRRLQPRWLPRGVGGSGASKDLLPSRQTRQIFLSYFFEKFRERMWYYIMG
jgi:hypothetical protein